MKVLLLTNWAGEQLGGGETYLLTLLDNLKDRCDFVVGAVGGSAIARAIDEAGVAVRAIPYASGPLAASTAIRRVIADEAVELVHAQGYYPGILARLACRDGVTPVVSTMHCMPDVVLESGNTATKRIAVRLRGLVDNLTAARACKVIAVAQSVMDGMVAQGFPRERLVLIDNGIDVEAVRAAAQEASPLPEASPNTRWIGFAARLERSKATERLFPMLALLPPDVRLAIAGDGPEAAVLRRAAREAGVEQRVDFLGHLSPAAPLLASVEVFVMPTPLGGKNLTVLEAMAVGTPVVAARGGAGEAVDNDVEGLLVDTADPNAFAEAVLTVLSDSDLAQRLGRAGRDRVARNFDSHAAFEATFGIYNECLVGHGGGERNE